MADRSYMAITVHACPEDKRPALLQLILDTFGQSQNDGETLTLGEQYTVEEIILGADSEMYGEIVEKVGLEGLTFDLQQEPKYEFDGFRHIQVDGLGLYRCAVNSSSTPIIDWEKVELLAGDPVALRRLFGRPWIEALESGIVTEVRAWAFDDLPPLLREQVLSKLPRPRDVGTAAYTAAWSAIEDVMINLETSLEEGGETEDPIRVAVTEAEAIREAADSIITTLRPDEPLPHVVGGFTRMTGLVADDNMGTCDCHPGVHVFRNDPDPCYGWADRDALALARNDVSESVADIFRAELANEEAMRRDAMSKQREDEMPPPATLSSVIDSIRQGLPICVDGSSEEEIETLLALLSIRDLLPGTTEIRALLP